MNNLIIFNKPVTSRDFQSYYLYFKTIEIKILKEYESFYLEQHMRIW